MKHIIYKIFFVSFIIINTITHADVVPYLDFRSQGFNAARELVGWQTFINKPEPERFYGAFSVSTEYSRSFRMNKLAEYLFCDALSNVCFCSTATTDYCCQGPISSCCCDLPAIIIQGSKIKTDPFSLIAENFYLPSDFESFVHIKPIISNFIIDFNLYLGLHNWCDGLYFRIHAPLTRTSWNLNFCERVVKPGTKPYDVGYVDNTIQAAIPQQYPNPTLDPNAHGLIRSQMLESFTDFIVCQDSIKPVNDITFNPLKAALISPCKLTKTRFAEITAVVGYNFLSTDLAHVGVNARIALPTGNRPHGTYLFEPVVGNGHHLELGAGFTSHWCCWRNLDNSKNFTMYLDANLTHLFKTRQCRTFDLCCNPLSRYMLACKFTNQIQDLKIGGDASTAILPLVQFAKEYSPVANITTIPVDVSAAMQGEVVVKCSYTYKNFQWDIGYDFWGRSCPNIIKRLDTCQTHPLLTGMWGLKGDAFVFGFPTIENPLIVTETAVPLSATESLATIFSGTNLPYDTWNQNWGVDNAALSWSSDNKILTTHVIGITNAAGQPIWQPTFSSSTPILITPDMLDTNSAATKGISHKLFMHFGHILKECNCIQPYWGAGFEAEVGSDNFQCCCSSRRSCCSIRHRYCQERCKTCASRCRTCSLSQWGIWLKGGISF